MSSYTQKTLYKNKKIVIKNVLFSPQILLICFLELIKFHPADIAEALTICFSTKLVCVFRKVAVFQYTNAVVVWGQKPTKTNCTNQKISAHENVLLLVHVFIIVIFSWKIKLNFN